MQCKFLIAFVLMGACLIQATSAQPTDVNGRILKGPIDNAIKDAKALIEKVIALIQQQVDAALNTLNELKQKVTEQVAQSIEKMKQKLQNIIDKAKEAVEELKKKAEQAGIDISNCVKDNESKFQEVFEQFLANEVQCVTGEVDEVMRIITETVQMMTNAIDTLKALPDELLNCTSNSKPLTCIAKVTANVIEIQKDLPKLIAKKVQEVTDFVAGLQTRLEVCATAQLANAGIAAAGVVGEIVKCAAEKGLELIES